MILTIFDDPTSTFDLCFAFGHVVIRKRCMKEGKG